MPDSEVRYCVLGIHYYRSDHPEFLQVDGKVVIFDTIDQARGYVERMSAGRFCAWDGEQEHAFFTPKVTTGYNEITIWTGYDPYDVNTGFASKGVKSEAKHLDWKRHVHVQEVWRTLLAFADQNSSGAFEKYVGNSHLIEDQNVELATV